MRCRRLSIVPTVTRPEGVAQGQKFRRRGCSSSSNTSIDDQVAHHFLPSIVDTIQSTLGHLDDKNKSWRTSLSGCMRLTLIADGQGFHSEEFNDVDVKEIESNWDEVCNECVLQLCLVICLEN